MLFVAGQPLSFLSADLFIRGVFFVFPLICALSSLFMVLYVVRHPGKIILPLIIYILTGILSWGLLIPFSVSKSEEYASIPHVQKKAPLITPGFFREDNGGIYYYSRVGQDGKAEGLYIDLQGFTGSQGKILPIDNVPVNETAAEPFSDLLIRDTMTLPRVVKVPVELYKKQLAFASASRKAGYISWLSFASIGIALLSILGLRRFSAWRLLNASIVTAAFFCIAGVNSACYGSGSFAGNAARSIVWWHALCPKFPHALSWFALQIQNPFVVLMNCGICLALIICGIVVAVVRNRREKAGTEDGE